MLVGETPFATENPEGVYVRIKNEEPAIPKYLSAVSSCLQPTACTPPLSH